MKIQLANRTYHQTWGGCCSCHFAKIYSKDRIINKITCPDFIPQTCHNAFQRQLFNDRIFKL